MNNTQKIEVDATGELSTIGMDGTVTYRFEQADHTTPMVMVLNLKDTPLDNDLRCYDKAVVKIIIEYPVDQ